MGRRRDDITGLERAQIAIEVLSKDRRWGTVTQLAKAHAMSRQTVYAIAATGEQVLVAGMVPGAHGPTPIAKRDRGGPQSVGKEYCGADGGGR